MRSFLSFFVVIAFSCFSLKGQVDSVYYGQPPGKEAKKRVEPKDESWKKDFSWGGNVQAWIGNPTFILLSPTLGYTPFKNFNVGLGGIYNFTSYSSIYGTYSQSIFGGHSYVRYTIADSYFVQAQFDKLFQPDLLSIEPNDRVWVDYLLIGGGFRQAVGEKVALTTSIMYNVNPDPLSIYPSRIIIQFGVIGNF
jgi:hypothetical protein